MSNKEGWVTAQHKKGDVYTVSCGGCDYNSRSFSATATADGQRIAIPCGALVNAKPLIKDFPNFCWIGSYSGKPADVNQCLIWPDGHAQRARENEQERLGL